jgi:Family of unknown function (DUF6309)
MKMLKRVSLDEVVAQFRSEHSADKAYEVNTNADAEISLAYADELLHEWHKVLLTRSDVLRVILPWHESEDGNTKLIPKSGLTVAQAVNKFAAVKDIYAIESPVCWNKIVRMGQSRFTPLFLSTKAIDTCHYNDLDMKEGLVHLDGLHRMLAWELHGRLAENMPIKAYIAGDIQQMYLP